ncbi:phosphoglycerate mutase-like protein 4 [Syzygium oleosum]|uniref:phosphoglycerate mutase-like protein 4 n=1 Tax=Syzygium oleosum TaxID=219896 RepID=UPI0011D262C7|nr:phosphoglycerate mutase-like protein 4 [Syzygium oleosum]
MEDAMHIINAAEPATSCSESRDAVELKGDRDAQSVLISIDSAEILLVRHGRTDWNVEKRIQGHLNVELNEDGRRQACAVADRLSKEGEISTIYSSDLKRAIETSELIATACGGVKVIKDSDLREQNPGKLQGLKENEAAKVYPQIHEAYRSSRWEQEVPGGGESKEQVYQRCTACLRNIGLKHKGERVVVVTHGTIFRCLYRRARPDETCFGPKVKNGSISILHLFGGDDWVLKSWGDVSHLNKIEEKL